MTVIAHSNLSSILTFPRKQGKEHTPSLALRAGESWGGGAELAVNFAPPTRESRVAAGG